MKYLTKFCLIILIMISCSEKEINNYIIPEERLIPMLCDFHIFDAASKQGVISNNRNNLVRHQHYKSILAKYQIKREKFDSTMQYYSQRPEKHKLMYQKVETALVKKMEEIN